MRKTSSVFYIKSLGIMLYVGMTNQCTGLLEYYGTVKVDRVKVSRCIFMDGCLRVNSEWGKKITPEKFEDVIIVKNIDGVINSIRWSEECLKEKYGVKIKEAV